MAKALVAAFDPFLPLEPVWFAIHLRPLEEVSAACATREQGRRKRP